MVLLRRRRHGFTLIEIVLVLAIMGVLSGMFMTGSNANAGKGKPYENIYTQRARDAVCTANRRTGLTQLFLDQIDSPGGAESPETLQKTAEKLKSHCSGEGRFYVDQGEIYCTQHIETPKFHELLGV